VEDSSGVGGEERLGWIIVETAGVTIFVLKSGKVGVGSNQKAKVGYELLEEQTSPAAASDP
jgi:hypothetical protein